MTANAKQLELTIKTVDTEVNDAKNDDEPDDPEVIKMIRKIKFGDIKDIHCCELLYFIYDEKTIHGPYSRDQIISLFIARDLSSSIYVKSADGGDWYQLKLPITSNELDEDKFVKENEILKNKLSDLYCSLQDIAGKAKQVTVPSPTDIPEPEKEELKKPSLFSLIVQLLGQILAIIMAIIVILHMFPGLIALFGFSCIFMCVAFLLRCCCNQFAKDDDPIYVGLAFITILFGYSGLVISPILMTYFFLTELNKWNEIQSWMIAYIVWGIIAYITATLYVGSIFIFPGKRIFNVLASLILLIIGIDFGDLKMFSDGGWSFWCMIICDQNGGRFTGITVLLLFPTIASLFPAAICGYIANFVLEEKFELRCGDDITNQYLCFDDGCCELISSHDIMNSYAFLGGLISNLVAIWAIIRGIGYLLVHAFPDLSQHAKRRKQ